MLKKDKIYYTDAAVLVKTKEKLSIYKNIEIPKLKRGQVLVKLSYSGVCHSQLMEIEGLRGKDKYLPHLLGHEGSGKVLEIGKGVKKIKKNDFVVLGWIKGTGLNVSGAKYYYKGKTINSGPVTTFSSLTVVSENRLVKMPKNYSLKEAVLFGCAIPTGAGMIFKDTKDSNKKTISITGLGGVGVMTLLAAKVMKFKKIIVIDTNEKKLKIAKKLGANFIVNPDKSDVVKKINYISNNKGVDYGIDCAGKTRTIELTFSIINKSTGSCIFCSHPTFGKKIKIDPFELISGKKIQGSWGGSIKPDIDIKVIAKKFQKFKKYFQKITAKEYSLNNINKAINDLKQGNVMRPIISFDKD